MVGEALSAATIDRILEATFPRGLGARVANGHYPVSGHDPSSSGYFHTFGTRIAATSRSVRRVHLEP